MAARWVVIGSGLVLFACGEPAHKSADAGEAALDSGPALDAGEPDAGPPDAGVPDAGPLEGLVDLRSLQTADGGEYSVSMVFGQTGVIPSLLGSFLSAQPTACGVMHVGTPTGLGGAGSGNALLSAGTVTVSDGPSTLFTLMAAADPGFYLGSASSMLHWSVDDTLTVSAKGADFPAFNASVLVPGAPAQVTPSFDSATPLSVSVRSDLSLSWTPGNGDVVQISLGQQTEFVYCGAADTGSLSIPAGDIAQLDSAQPAALLVQRVKAAVVQINANDVVNVQVASGVGTQVTLTP
jgi:hypothetical protein